MLMLQQEQKKEALKKVFENAPAMISNASNGAKVMMVNGGGGGGGKGTGSSGGVCFLFFSLCVFC